MRSIPCDVVPIIFRHEVVDNAQQVRGAQFRRNALAFGQATLERQGKGSIHSARVQCNGDRIFILAPQFDCEIVNQLVQSCLRSAITVPSTKTIVFQLFPVSTYVPDLRL